MIIALNRWVVAALLIGLGSGFGVARDETPRRDAVEISVSARVDMTDNRDSAESNEESNTDIFLSPQINIYLQSPVTVLDFFYSPAYRHRTDPSPVQNDGEFLHDLGAELRHEVSESLSFRFKEFFNYTDDPSISDGGAMVRDDRTYVRNRVEASMKAHGSTYSYATLSVMHEMKRYDEDAVAEQSDEDIASVRVMLWKQIARSLALVGVGGYGLYDYEDVLGVDRDSDVVTVAAGLERIFSPELRGGFRVGAQMLAYADDTLDSETYPYVEADILLSPSPDARLSTRVGHGVRSPDVFPFSSQEFTELKVRGEIDASPSVTVGLDGTYRLSQYDDKARPSAAAPDLFVTDATSGDETTIVVRGDIMIELASHSRLKFSQLLEDVDSDVEISFSKNTSILEYQVDF